MRTDIAKVSFDELNHYVGVFSQMGRLPLESDINEQNELVLRMLQRLAGDTIHTGSPNQGFRVDTHVLLDALDTRQGWSATPANAALFIDYFDHRVGDGSLVALGATAVARQLAHAMDFSAVNEVLIAVKAVPLAPVSPAVFYVKDAAATHAFTMSTVATDDGWTLMRALPGAWPVGFAADKIVEYGFSGLTATSRYSFDFLKVDVPLPVVLLRPERTELYAATPTSASLSIDDDQRLWGSTSLAVTDATELAVTLPVPSNLSRSRALLIAVQNPAAAPLAVRLTDNAAVPVHIDLAGAVSTTLTTPTGTWQVLRYALPQAGTVDWSAIATLTYRTLDATATYTFGAVLLEADPAKDLVVMGGDGTSAGAGRFYGEGLAATKEAHGTYFTQPDLPQADPAALAPVAADKRRIDWAYLDLWERPLTYLEQANLREVALEGDDTCTRRQLVAQVRLLKGVEVPLAYTAAPPADAFALLPRIGHGLLTTKDKPAAVLDPCADPCEPAIEGPYLGEDNRLFRVEIHRAGDIGLANVATTALFKWSRHNGAVASGLIADAPVGAFSVQVEKPERFAVGDLIEVSDDLMELATGVYEDRVAHAKHQRGFLRRVVTVNLQTRRVSWEDPTVVDPLLAPFHAALSQPLRTHHHAKITQWDDVQAVVSGDIVLADGVVIEFGGSHFVAGDYWQFATRTVNRSVERLIDAPPRGTAHAFYPLAAIHRSRAAGPASEVVFCEDLRPRFAALPSLDASRVSYDPGACAAEHHIDGWEDVSTVQQAIDALCRADLTGDLKLHNKLLHGMGVICGLKLRCSKDRTQVILGKGYALDCEGNLLHQAGDMSVALVAQAQAQGLLNGAGDGDVNVWIEQGAAGLTVELEPHINQPFMQSVLEGTLLKDFFDKYVLGLLNFFKAQLTPFPDPTLPLSDQHKRVISLINLIWQIVNSANGPYVFVSKTEHDLLEKFHQELQDFLASKTYCAMFDSLTVFPAYPYAVPPGIETMFGLFNFHRRMRAAPGDQYVVTCGTGNKIQFFDLTTQQAVAVTTFPAAANANVQDVAFSPDGSEMYAVATIIQGANVDSIFATATITPPAVAGDAPTLTWGPASVVCGYKFVTLATHDKQANRLFAIAVGHDATDSAKRGLHRFTLPVIPLAPTPLVNFHATGLFTIDTNGLDAVATEHSGGAITGAFDRLRKLNVQTGATSSPWAAVGGNDYNDLVCKQGVAYLTAGNTLNAYTLATSAAAAPVPLGSFSVWRLAYLPNTNAVLISDANTYRIRVFDTGTGTLANIFRIPLQVMPISLAARSDETRVYALNLFSNTVNVIDVATLIANTPSFTAEPPATLAAYRKQMLQAFTDLVSVLGQYFKDGFCDQFLIECPECDKDDKLYLATIHIKGSKVFNICNFSKRHYAKSFRTWGYWLSAVPILPLIKKAFAKFCCSTLVP